MGSSLRKFVNREPRYTLRPGENRHMRFADDADPRNIHSSKVLNLSNSGAAFVVFKNQAPFIYDRIRIELPVGDSDSIAWWAKVVRVQEYNSPRWFEQKHEGLNNESEDNQEVLVAVHFEPLPVPHAAKLHKDLMLKFREVESLRKKEAFQMLQSIWSNYTWEILIYFSVVLAGIWILWALSRPTPHYDAEKGAPWGKRMWFIEDAPGSK